MTASLSRSVRLPQGFQAMEAGNQILNLRKPLRKVVNHG